MTLYIGDKTKCDVCDGAGVITFYVQVYAYSPSYDETTGICPSCFGKGHFIKFRKIDVDAHLASIALKMLETLKMVEEWYASDGNLDPVDVFSRVTDIIDLAEGR